MSLEVAGLRGDIGGSLGLCYNLAREECEGGSAAKGHAQRDDQPEALSTEGQDDDRWQMPAA